MKVALPIPFGVIFKSILVSPPVAAIEGALPVAALVNVNSLTAEPVVVNISCSFEFSSRIPWAVSTIRFWLFVSKFAESCGE